MTPTWTTELLYEQGLTAAYEMGLTGQTAIQYATNSSATSSLSNWMSYIGLGTGALKLATDPSRKGAWNLALSAMSIPAGLFALPIGLISGLASYSHAQTEKHRKHYIYWHKPNFEVIGEDADGYVYLYDTNFSFAQQKLIRTETEGDSSHSSDKGHILRYNPQTNELQRADTHFNTGQKHAGYRKRPSFVQALSLEEAKAYLAGEDPEVTIWHYESPRNKRRCREIERQGGYCYHSKKKRKWICKIPEQHHLSERNPVRKGDRAMDDSWESDGFRLNWEAIDLSHNWNPQRHARSMDDPVFTDPNTFQAEIFNKILVPGGHTDQPSVDTGWTSVTMAGQSYLVNSDGHLANETGQLIGVVNPDSGQVLDFYAIQGRSRLHKDGDVDWNIPSYLGYIDDWIGPPESAAMPGMVGQLTGFYNGTETVLDLGQDGNLYSGNDIVGTWTDPKEGNFYNLDLGDQGSATFDYLSGEVTGENWTSYFDYEPEPAKEPAKKPITFAPNRPSFLGQKSSAIPRTSSLTTPSWPSFLSPKKQSGGWLPPLK